MSGAGYIITNNEGRLDQLILGNAVLKQRIEYVRAVRAKMIAQGQLRPEDANPSLGDIEQTHIIFTHAQFKSYASINFEYYKANPQGGSQTLKADQTTPLDFQIPQYGDFIGDVVAHLSLSFPTYTYDSSNRWGIRACDYPGIRLLQRVALSVNSNNLDEYDQEVALFTKQFMVPSHKQAAYDRCMGQEEVLNARQSSIAMYSMNGSTSGPRMWQQFTNGPQTPKLAAGHSDIEMFIPLHLFHNDIRLALPAVCLPSSQRYFSLTLASTKQLFGFAPLNSSSAAPNPLSTMGNASLTIAELYINNIFIHDDVHEIFIDRIGFNLIRTHKAQDFNLTESEGQHQVSQFKFPTETVFVGVRPTANLASGSTAVEDPFLDLWHRYSSVSRTAITFSDAQSSPEEIPGLTFQVPSFTRTITKQGFISQGVDLYKEFPAAFYDSYIPYNYGGCNISAPKQGDGGMMAPFNFYPGTYQPSGYVNISRSQSFYWKYTSSFISTSNPCTAYLRSIALNFLVITDGNAYIRYLT
jgi:hypothetical protein